MLSHMHTVDGHFHTVRAVNKDDHHLVRGFMCFGVFIVTGYNYSGFYDFVRFLWSASHLEGTCDGQS